MALAIFDLDHTLLSGDSDYAWGQFLVERHLVDGDTYERENRRYFDQYKSGTLDIYAFLGFALRPLTEHAPAQLQTWHREFMQAKIRPMITPAARALVEQHRARGDTLLIITATNGFVTRPIAAEFGIDHLLATEPELVDGHYTGRVSGTPCFREGKVERLRAWLKEHKETLRGSAFYSDSHNDLPLLSLVDQPVAVNPDPVLAAHARAHAWPVLRLE